MRTMTREDAKTFMRKAWRETTKGSYAEEAYEMSIKALEQPTNDQQPEITYCKDCLFGHFYADIINGVMDTWVECRNPDGLNRDVSVDGYCYAAIRREQNETD